MGAGPPLAAFWPTRPPPERNRQLSARHEAAEQKAGAGLTARRRGCWRRRWRTWRRRQSAARRGRASLRRPCPAATRRPSPATQHGPIESTEQHVPVGAMPTFSCHKRSQHSQPTRPRPQPSFDHLTPVPTIQCTPRPIVLQCGITGVSMRSPPAHLPAPKGAPATVAAAAALASPAVAAPDTWRLDGRVRQCGAPRVVRHRLIQVRTGFGFVGFAAGFGRARGGEPARGVGAPARVVTAARYKTRTNTHEPGWSRRTKPAHIRTAACGGGRVRTAACTRLPLPPTQPSPAPRLGCTSRQPRVRAFPCLGPRVCVCACACACRACW
jgi:hypothetical protein